jgi:hypothetical protein
MFFRKNNKKIIRIDDVLKKNANMSFRKNNTKIIHLDDLLKKNANQLFVCEDFVAMWSTDLQEIVAFNGNYLGMTDEEILYYFQMRWRDL